MLNAHLIRPGNFTPPTRTPWGGHRIVGTYKAALFPHGDQQRVGESWEISVEPSFPSVLDNGEPLARAIAEDPIAWLGPAIAERFDRQSPILVKLIDAAATLSVQVHPPEDHALLTPGESGKTEAWIILDADHGAQIYLGFVSGTTRREVEARLADGSPIENLMNAVPVRPGDTFFIRPGTIHALGAGVALLEPQLVLPGKRAVTYRFYDFNRRYDAHGEPDPNGQPRPLHIREAAAVTNWETQGEAFVESCRRRPAVVGQGALQRTRLLEDTFFVEEWRGSGHGHVPAVPAMLGALCLSGSAELHAGGATLSLAAGRTAVIPAAAVPHTTARLDHARVMFCAMNP